MLYEMKKYDQAIATFSQAEQVQNLRHVDSHRIPVRIGYVQLAMKRYDEAERAARNGGGCDDLACKQADELLRLVQEARQKEAEKASEKEQTPAPSGRT